MYMNVIKEDAARKVTAWKVAARRVTDRSDS